jgi:hypothetical protein
MQINNNRKDDIDMPGKIARLSIDLLAADHKRLKTVASLMGMTMKDLVVVSVGDFMQHRLGQITKTSKKQSKDKKKPKAKARRR